MTASQSKKLKNKISKIIQNKIKAAEIDNDLKKTVDNLKKDDLEMRLEYSRSGDNRLTIKTRHYKTIILANDLGFWLERQSKISNSKRRGFVSFLVLGIITALIIASAIGYFALKQLKEESVPVKTPEEKNIIKMSEEEKNSKVITPVQCPQWAPPAPGWCSNGKIILQGNNERGCPQPPRCERD